MVYFYVAFLYKKGFQTFKVYKGSRLDTLKVKNELSKYNFMFVTIIKPLRLDRKYWIWTVIVVTSM